MKSEVRSCFCNGDLSNSPKTFCLKRQGIRPNYFDNLLEINEREKQLLHRVKNNYFNLAMRLVMENMFNN